MPQPGVEKWTSRYARSADYERVLHSSPVWKRHNLNFQFLIDGVWTIEDLKKSNPNETVEMRFYSDDAGDHEIKRLEESLRTALVNDKDVQVISSANVGFGDSYVTVSLPASRHQDVYDFSTEYIGIFGSPETLMFSGFELTKPSETQRSKRASFVKALVSPWQEKIKGRKLSIRSIEDASYKDLFESNHKVDNTMLGYLDFLRQMRNGSVISTRTHKSILAMSLR